jgi:hypothetical protein
MSSRSISSCGPTTIRRQAIQSVRRFGRYAHAAHLLGIARCRVQGETLRDSRRQSQATTAQSAVPMNIPHRQARILRPYDGSLSCTTTPSQTIRSARRWPETASVRNSSAMNPKITTPACRSYLVHNLNPIRNVPEIPKLPQLANASRHEYHFAYCPPRRTLKNAKCQTELGKQYLAKWDLYSSRTCCQG